MVGIQVSLTRTGENYHSSRHRRQRANPNQDPPDSTSCTPDLVFRSVLPHNRCLVFLFQKKQKKRAKIADSDSEPEIIENSEKMDDVENIDPNKDLREYLSRLGPFWQLCCDFRLACVRPFIAVNQVRPTKAKRDEQTRAFIGGLVLFL